MKASSAPAEGSYLDFKTKVNHVDENILVACFECDEIHQTVDGVEYVFGVVLHEYRLIELR
jgi:hypothetical protein